MHTHSHQNRFIPTLKTDLMNPSSAEANALGRESYMRFFSLRKLYGYLGKYYYINNSKCTQFSEEKGDCYVSLSLTSWAEIAEGSLESTTFELKYEGWSRIN